MPDSLLVRDGNGNFKNLEVISGSVEGNIVPVHSITGSLSASLSEDQYNKITSSLDAIPGAITDALDKFTGALLANGSSSFNVDLISQDVADITGSIEDLKVELEKLTALSSSEGHGFKVYGNLTASLDRGATADDPLYVKVSSSLDEPVYVTHSGSLTTAADYASTVVTGSYTFTQAQSVQSASDTEAKTLTIANQANNMLFVTIDGQTPSPTNYSLAIDPFSTYEAMAQNVRLEHKFILTGSATTGRVVYTITK
jgi:hypothetical protein